MAKLKTDEHRSAQDGRMSHSINDDKIDIRVSIVPIIGGEKIVMRLLSDRNRQFTLSNLGMDPKGMEIVHKHANRSFGMILVTGPTGSGKSTTLYAIIKTLNSLKVNIATIEDPIEYDIEGVNQIQVNSKTNLTFVSGLKSILRQDPDIIMLGEIRDDETASLAINAALTGHLLLSTLHTNDAATTMPRLEEMKVTRYLITSAVSIIISQRLIRRLCTGCLYTYAITPEEQDMMAHNPDLARWLASNLSEKKLFFKAKGCKICHSTGYAGRVGIFEILEMSEEIRKIILTGADAGQIRSKAITLGMKTMLEDGMDKVLVGQTTYEEVIRAISM
jgi:type II secretory ATPase GspE/PulE/Tfp pilus assembly ATPase PilB-like protein